MQEPDLVLELRARQHPPLPGAANFWAAVLGKADPGVISLVKPICCTHIAVLQLQTSVWNGDDNFLFIICIHLKSTAMHVASFNRTLDPHYGLLPTYRPGTALDVFVEEGQACRQIKEDTALGSGERGNLHFPPKTDPIQGLYQFSVVQLLQNLERVYFKSLDLPKVGLVT